MQQFGRHSDRGSQTVRRWHDRHTQIQRLARWPFVMNPPFLGNIDAISEQLAHDHQPANQRPAGVDIHTIKNSQDSIDPSAQLVVLCSRFNVNIAGALR